MRQASAVAAVLTVSIFTSYASSVPPAAFAAPPAAREKVDTQAGAAATEKVEQTDFDALAAAILKARESGEWRDADWAARAGIERSLTRLLEGAGRAAGREGLKAGTRLADVRAGDLAPGRSAGVLHVGRDVDVSFADRCVLLADNSVRVSHASDCVIVAGGAVHVSHGRRNVIVAGHYLHVSHDGNAFPRDEPGGHGSVLLAGQLLDVAHAKGSVCSSPGEVRISHANGVTFVNSPDVKTSHRNGCREVAEAALAPSPPTHVNPLAGKLTITQAAGGGEAHHAMVVTRQGDVELVTRLGAEVTGADGKPLDGLAGWRLSYVTGQFALFRRGTETAGFVMPGRP